MIVDWTGDCKISVKGKGPWFLKVLKKEFPLKKVGIVCFKPLPSNYSLTYTPGKVTVISKDLGTTFSFGGPQLCKIICTRRSKFLTHALVLKICWRVGGGPKNLKMCLRNILMVPKDDVLSFLVCWGLCRRLGTLETLMLWWKFSLDLGQYFTTYIYTMYRQWCDRERPPRVFPSSVGAFCLERPLKFQLTYFEGPFQMKRPHRSWKDPWRSWKGSFPITSLTAVHIKLGYSEKGTKFEKNLPLKIWHYSVASNSKRKIFSNLVFFSECLNFTKCKGKNEL